MNRLEPVREGSAVQVAINDAGWFLVGYRCRSENKVLEISNPGLIDGVWSEARMVSRDGWIIEGCPVNELAFDTALSLVVSARFAVADDIPSVKVAFSVEDGGNFGLAIRIDESAPNGRN